MVNRVSILDRKKKVENDMLLKGECRHERLRMAQISALVAEYKH